MRRAAFLLLLLAGCSGGAADNTPEQACVRQAEDDPAVTELVRKGAGNLSYQWQNADQLNAAREQAKLKCLRARGLAPKGGVELPRQR
jgi:hypothetical protein